MSLTAEWKYLMISNGIGFGTSHRTFVNIFPTKSIIVYDYFTIFCATKTSVGF